MMRSIPVFLFVFLFGIAFTVTAQVTLTPSYPTVQDSITITYDATQGSTGLAGSDKVYMHSGVVKTPGGTAWTNVVGNWGVDDGIGEMTEVTENIWQIKIDPVSYYSLSADENIFRLAMVFRNANGTQVGKTAAGGDFFIDIDPGYYVTVTSPSVTNPFVIVNEPITISATASASSTLKIFIGNKNVKTEKRATSISYTTTFSAPGSHKIKVSADGGAEKKNLEFKLTVVAPNVIAERPAGVKDGINYLNANTVVLSLFAPDKKFVYATGTFNNWQTSENYRMKQTPDGKRFWIQLNNLIPQQEYIFQYVIDGNLRIADPYTDKVADPWNDKNISSTTYPGLLPYTQEAYGIASVLQTGQTPYEWQVTDFQGEPESKLMIYELLIRDFTAAHSYQSVIDSIQYLKKLGINAIELMPVNEFEGNESWGYNPSFFFAPDKYYGHKNKLKELIDVAHANGMAVIIDMVLNHAFGQNVMARMYWDESNNRPAANNPWFNQTSPNTCWYWGSDFNHESVYTQQFVDSVNTYWLTEYNVDGFRFDFTKGFTNTQNCGWEYDQSRIDILKRMSNKIWSVKPDAYVILEHLTDQSEEDVLADHGMLLWKRVDGEYKEVISGHQLATRSFAAAQHNERVVYMESHDEERIMVQNLRWGNSNGAYNIQDTVTALDRIEMGAAFLYTVPGPKMIWMFGEQGYDYSIDYNGRVGNKPLVWSEYMQDAARVNTYNTFAELLNLRKDHPVFTEGFFTWKSVGETRWINITHSSMNVVILGNFGVTTNTFTPSFPHQGTWYNYFAGLDFDYQGGDVTLAPGEWVLLTDVKLQSPEGFQTSSILTIEPENFTADDTIRITLNAKNAWGNLSGAEKIYMHSGVVLTSPTGTAWSNVVGNWGADDGVGEMTSLGNDKWQITIHPRSYYNLAADQPVFRLAMVFRDASGIQTGKGPANRDIYVNVALPPMAAPSNLSATASALNVSLTWADNATAETGYIVEKSVTSSSGFEVIASLPANTASYSDAVSSPGTYYYRVKGTGENEETNYSNEANVSVILGFTVYFYKPSNWSSANIYYWNVIPSGSVPDTGWPGPAMIAAPEQGANWYKFTFTGASSANLIFNSNGSPQTSDLSRNRDGWYRDGVWYDEKPAELIIHFQKPAGWSSVNMHYWNVSPAGIADTSWPGVVMQDEGDGWFTYTITGATCANMVFNSNGSPQTGDTYRCGEGWYANGTWFDSKPQDMTIYFKKPATWSTAYIHYWDVTPAGAAANTNWPGKPMQAEGDDWYSFAFAGAECVNIVFNNNSSPQTQDLRWCGDGWYDGTWHSTDPRTSASARTSVAETGEEKTEGNLLYQNFPNPFETSTTITFTLEEKQFVNLSVLNIQGQRVQVLVNETLDKGEHSVVLERQSLPRGIYVYQLDVNKTQLRKRLVVN